jgi:FkbM family methyltransferase
MKSIFYSSASVTKLRFSALFLKTWLLLNPEVKKKLARQRKYYLTLIGHLRSQDVTVLDVGANEGFVSEIFLNNGFKVIGIEPDPRNVQVLKARFDSLPNFELYPCLCASDAESRQFWLNKNNAFSTSSLKWKSLLTKGSYRYHSEYTEKPLEIPAITLNEILRNHRKIGFAKIDTEGAELECLRGLSEKIPLITFEANLPEFEEETISCIRHLAAIDEKASFGYSSNFNLHSKYMGAELFCKFIRTVTGPTIDVICRMSNYQEFYDS